MNVNICEGPFSRGGKVVDAAAPFIVSVTLGWADTSLEPCRGLQSMPTSEPSSRQARRRRIATLNEIPICYHPIRNWRASVCQAEIKKMASSQHCPLVSASSGYQAPILLLSSMRQRHCKKLPSKKPKRNQSPSTEMPARMRPSK
jgi:hypothetical protein